MRALVLAAALAVGLAGQARTPVRPQSLAPRSVAGEQATFVLQPGYAIDCMAAEPLVHEPVMAVFDAAARLWVAEMHTYVQDVDGTGTDEPRSAVAVLEDRDGDGRMDVRHDYATGLVLPRLLLPLDRGRALVQETYDGFLWLYHDDDGDLRSDRREVVHRYPPSRANLEHQDSGLIWGIDNWLYTARGGVRLRLGASGDVVATAAMTAHNGQWGLATDDLGRQFVCSAGGENPGYGYQQHRVYGEIEIPGTRAEGFMEVWPALALPDVQGGLPRLRADGSLNHFTGCCGPVIHRGDGLPDDARGDYFLAEPVGRLIRRAEVQVRDGRRVLANRYDRGELLTSTDANFRPTWLLDGPDGCLWVVDMYRGIIQESNWVREGSYLRPVVVELGLDRNIGRGRIWRIRRDGAAPPAARRVDRLGDLELVDRLGHRAGFVRDHAQRLLVLRQARAQAPALRALLGGDGPPLGRVHALWTLDGLGLAGAADVAGAMADVDPRVRATAVRVAEPLLATARPLQTALVRLASDPDLDVRIQVLQSARHLPGDAGRDLAIEIMAAHADNELVRAVGATTLAHGGTGGGGDFDPARFTAADLGRLRAGREHYAQLCATCHGGDGSGVVVPGENLRMAPPLAGSRRLLAGKETAVRILLHGLVGELEGKTYAGGMMAPMAQQDDEWIAAVLTYARNAFGNGASPLDAAEVARVRAASTGRDRPYLAAELEAFLPLPAAEMRQWTLTASHAQEACGHAIDGEARTRFTTGTPMRPGMWLAIDFAAPLRVHRLVLDCRGSPQDYPRGFDIQVSNDGIDWSEPVAAGVGRGPVVDIELQSRPSARHLRIVQTGSSADWWWSIHDLQVFGSR